MLPEKWRSGKKQKFCHDAALDIFLQGLFRFVSILRQEFRLEFLPVFHKRYFPRISLWNPFWAFTGISYGFQLRFFPEDLTWKSHGFIPHFLPDRKFPEDFSCNYTQRFSFRTSLSWFQSEILPEFLPEVFPELITVFLMAWVFIWNVFLGGFS